MNKKYPDMFYDYAFSGQGMCSGCKAKIKQQQDVFVFEGNIYHDICSEKYEKREKLERDKK